MFLAVLTSVSDPGPNFSPFGSGSRGWDQKYLFIFTYTKNIYLFLLISVKFIFTFFITLLLKTKLNCLVKFTVKYGNNEHVQI